MAHRVFNFVLEPASLPLAEILHGGKQLGSSGPEVLEEESLSQKPQESLRQTGRGAQTLGSEGRQAHQCPVVQAVTVQWPLTEWPSGGLRI